MKLLRKLRRRVKPRVLKPRLHFLMKHEGLNLLSLKVPYRMA
jgi:hypothetical protein